MPNSHESWMSWVRASQSEYNKTPAHLNTFTTLEVLPWADLQCGSTSDGALGEEKDGDVRLINEEGKRAVCRSRMPPARGRKNPDQVLRPNTSAFRRANMHPGLHTFRQHAAFIYKHTHTSVKQLGRLSVQHCSLTCRNRRWRINLWYSWLKFLSVCASLSLDYYLNVQIMAFHLV